MHIDPAPLVFSRERMKERSAVVFQASLRSHNLDEYRTEKWRKL